MQNRRPLSLKVAPELPLLSLHPPCGTLSWASLRAGSAGKGRRQHLWFCLPDPERQPGFPRVSPERQRVWKLTRAPLSQLLMGPPRFWLFPQVTGTPSLPASPHSPSSCSAFSGALWVLGRPTAVSASVEGPGYIHTGVKCWHLQNRGRGICLRRAQYHRDTHTAP